MVVLRLEVSKLLKNINIIFEERRSTLMILGKLIKPLHK
jgi:hypothetical protein